MPRKSLTFIENQTGGHGYEPMINDVKISIASYGTEKKLYVVFTEAAYKKLGIPEYLRAGLDVDNHHIDLYFDEVPKNRGFRVTFSKPKHRPSRAYVTFPRIDERIMERLVGTYALVHDQELNMYFIEKKV